MEGGTTRTYANIKSMCHTAPHVLKSLLSHLTRAISEYIIFQVKSGAQCIQIFDSWGGQIPPNAWEQWSRPYIQEVWFSIKFYFIHQGYLCLHARLTSLGILP